MSLKDIPMSGGALPKSRLGRGLASLIGDSSTIARGLPPEGEHRVVPIDQVHQSALNPRKAFDEEELFELTESIRQRGLVQPIIVRIDPQRGGFEIVAGERRWRASQQAGKHEVPVVVRELSDQEMLELAIIENVQRADLNPIEEAGGYNELIVRYGYTQDQLAEVIGKSRSHLANTLRLLRLPVDVQDLVNQGRLSAGHARALVGREDASMLAERIVAQGLNVREVEALVQRVDKTGSVNPPARGRDKDADTRAFEEELAQRLGLKVEIKRGSGESGQLVIRFGNYDQLDYLRDLLQGLPSGARGRNDDQAA
jgi:ParB family transcriptional regulator, chromosome partitioning protein